VCPLASLRCSGVQLRSMRIHRIGCIAWMGQIDRTCFEHTRCDGRLFSRQMTNSTRRIRWVAGTHACASPCGLLRALKALSAIFPNIKAIFPNLGDMPKY
jgi:hypothetical protein